MIGPETSLHVLAIKILAFSIRFGQLTPIVLSRMKPSSRYESVSFPPTFLMIWMCSRSVEPYRQRVSRGPLVPAFDLDRLTFNRRTASTARFAK